MPDYKYEYNKPERNFLTGPVEYSCEHMGSCLAADDEI